MIAFHMSACQLLECFNQAVAAADPDMDSPAMKINEPDNTCNDYRTFDLSCLVPRASLLQKHKDVPQGPKASLPDTPVQAACPSQPPSS